jgi:hypothetical protein
VSTAGRADVALDLDEVVVVAGTVLVVVVVVAGTLLYFWLTSMCRLLDARPFVRSPKGKREEAAAGTCNVLLFFSVLAEEEEDGPLFSFLCGLKPSKGVNRQLSGKSIGNVIAVKNGWSMI